MIFDHEKPFSFVGGRLPVTMMQGGYGFNNAHECLGEVDDAGRLIESGIDRETLEAEAEALNVKFRSSISDEKLKERIEAAKE